MTELRALTKSNDANSVLFKSTAPGPEFGTPSRRHVPGEHLLKYGVAASFALGLICLFFSADSLAAANGEVAYSIVIDCGSTGTRLYVYGSSSASLPRIHNSGSDSLGQAKKTSGQVQKDEKAYKRKETEPGLDKFVRDSKGLRSKALTPLLEWALQKVPPLKRGQTPIFLFATAGLRRLPIPDSDWLLT